MNRLVKTTLLAGVTVLGLLTSSDLMAQNPPGGGGGAAGGGGGGGGRRGGGGGQPFDPAAMQQRMLDRTRETLGVTDDAEWKVISDRLSKLMTIRMETMRAGFGGMGRMGRPGGGGPGGGGPGGGGPGGGGPGMFGQQPPEVEALQNAIEANNTSDIKDKLTALRDYRVKKQDELKKAQADLKKVLNLKQEAQLVLMGQLE